ncbi:unnamed protein product, partial [Brassica oleracea]
FGVHLSIWSWSSYKTLLFIVKPTSKSDYPTGAIGLLGFYYYRALDFYHFYRFYRFLAFGLLSIVYDM